MDFSEKISNLTSQIIEWSPKFFTAIAILVIGWWVIKKIEGVLNSVMDNSALSEEIKPFLSSLLSLLLKVLLIFTVAGVVGIETTSFVAMLAAVGFAVGMALQGSLGNIAAGVMILLFRPYKIGDYITLGDDSGFVKQIQIINTIITTLSNEDVIIPNSMALGDKIVNSTGSDGLMRAEFHVGMPYDESFDKFKSIIEETLMNTDKVLKDPPPLIHIDEFDTHYIKVAVKPYTRIEDYESAYGNSTKNVKAALGKNGIKMAYSEGVEMGDIGV